MSSVVAFYMLYVGIQSWKVALSFFGFQILLVCVDAIVFSEEPPLAKSEPEHKPE